jgi:hypothetical protein
MATPSVRRAIDTDPSVETVADEFDLAQAPRVARLTMHALETVALKRALPMAALAKLLFVMRQSAFEIGPL